MNEADRVKGIAGDHKRAAVRLEDEGGRGDEVLAPPREPLGERDQGRDLGAEVRSSGSSGNGYIQISEGEEGGR